MKTTEELLREIGGLTDELLAAWINEGWIQPKESRSAIYFTDVDVARIRMIRDFRIRMQIDEESIRLMLNLIDQVYGLRLQLKTLSRAVATLPEDMRRQVREYMAAQLPDEPENGH